MTGRIARTLRRGLVAAAAAVPLSIGLVGLVAPPAAAAPGARFDPVPVEAGRAGVEEPTFLRNAIGGCCFADGACATMTAEMCGMVGGTWLGAGIACGGTACNDAVAGGFIGTDIVFILDGSSSISDEELTLQLEGLAAAVEDPTVVPRDGSVAFGVVQMATLARIEVPLTRIESDADATDVADAIRDIEQLGGFTSMSLALKKAVIVLECGCGAPGARQVICVSTDGMPNFPELTLHAAELAMLVAEEIDAIGIGDETDPDFLQALADVGNGVYAAVADFEEFAATVGEKIDAVLGGDDGACCLPTLECVILTEDDCATEGGIYLGEDTECGDVCCEYTIDFETDDAGTPLADGDRVMPGLNFGTFVWISGTGANNLGTAIFDTDPTGPNAGSQDEDLLVDSGNALILQELGSALCGPDRFCDSNDASSGGEIHFEFALPVRMLSLVVVDIDLPGGLGARVTLEDDLGNAVSWRLRPGFTLEAERRTLDLTLLADQPGSLADAVYETVGGWIALDRVVRMTIRTDDSMAVDDVWFCRAIVERHEDDGG